MREYLKSGRMAIRLLYFFVISMALTRSTYLLFSPDNTFDFPDLEKLALYIVFLSFIVRFCLGAYRILTENIELEFKREKIIFDSFIFFVQALFFYVYSLTFNEISDIVAIIAFICIVDIIWLAVLRLRFKIKSKTFRQWIFHNLFFIFIYPAIFYILNWDNPYLLLIVSGIACCYDLWRNQEFYFATSTSGLRIFIAGPYGDKKSKRVIEGNVKRAREIGKEIALKGHFPFIPHTMLHGWEKDKRFTIPHFTAIDHQWLEYCDALFFISPSPGANIELAIAENKGLRIFRKLDDVPDLRSR